MKAEFVHADGQNYQPIEPLTSTFEILKAEHPPIDGVRLVSMQTTYDGNEHFLVIEGQLPSGVSVSYQYYLGETLVTDGDGNAKWEARTHWKEEGLIDVIG